MKKIHILRLGSVVPNGVEGPKAGAGCIDLIYSFLLQEYNLNFYSYIKINQIGKDLNELILKEGKNIHINIDYPAQENFEQLSSLERNKIRLNIVHKALVRIAEYDKKIEIPTLDLIKQRILDQNFSFDFVYQSFVDKSNPDFTAEIIVHPMENCFKFYCAIWKNKIRICHQLIYEGISVPIYFRDFFSRVRWKKDRLVIFGNEDKIEMHVLFESCEVQYVNLTAYSKHPRFELCRAFLTPGEKEKAHKDWMHSLPPAIAAIVRESEN